MVFIWITERNRESHLFNATVSFDNGPEYPITIQDQFSIREESELEWCFEEYLEFPFTQKV